MSFLAGLGMGAAQAYMAKKGADAKIADEKHRDDRYEAMRTGAPLPKRPEKVDAFNDVVGKVKNFFTSKPTPAAPVATASPATESTAVPEIAPAASVDTQAKEYSEAFKDEESVSSTPKKFTNSYT